MTSACHPVKCPPCNPTTHRGRRPAARVVVAGTPRLDGRYHLFPIDVIYPEDYEKSPDAVRAITQRFTTGLETLIRKAPEQYFWLHRRWKHAPPVRGKKKAA